MKYLVTCACGHTEEVQIIGPSAQREIKVKHLEQKLCQACRAIDKHSDFDLVRMRYQEYKRKYFQYDILPGSYDQDEKTIKVFVPRRKYKFPKPTYTADRQKIVEELIGAGIDADQVSNYIAIGSARLQDLISTLQQRIKIQQIKAQKRLDKEYLALEILKKYEEDNNGDDKK